MGYKSKFSGLEVYSNGQWTKVNDPEDYSSEMHPLSTDPIAEQVANIHLPDTRTVR
jgi:arginine-tRNA-protein transferase